MKQALEQLLNALDRVFEEHEEVGDTAVREAMYDAVSKSFVLPEAGYTLPTKFQMFSAEGNQAVHAALRDFLAHPEIAAAAESLKTPEERLAAFQDSDAESSDGNIVEEYFGYSDAP